LPRREPAKKENEVRAHYGYADGTGDYFITIDTDKCDGCGECVTACQENILELAEDDYGKVVARVRDEVRIKLGYLCPGFDLVCSRKERNCHTVCKREAISHTW
jgi:NAD-dependent dihydropyrimidine dehydrogenase PreA subunit